MEKLRNFGPWPNGVPKFCAQQVSVSITITRLRFGKRLIPAGFRDELGFTDGLLAPIRHTNNCNPRGALDEPKPL
jgi:hypothetical protein